MSSKQVKWNWSNECQKAFDTITKLVSKRTLFSYPTFNEPFVMHMDANKSQSGVVFSQDDKPIAFYSREMNPAN